MKDPENVAYQLQKHTIGACNKQNHHIPWFPASRLRRTEGNEHVDVTSVNDADDDDDDAARVLLPPSTTQPRNTTCHRIIDRHEHIPRSPTLLIISLNLQQTSQQEEKEPLHSTVLNLVLILCVSAAIML